jgi:prefoldin subunit 5
MKITVNQLRRIIKEEVESVVRMNETDVSRVNSINTTIEEMKELMNALEEQGIDTSELEETIEALEAQLTFPDAFKAGGVIDDTMEESRRDRESYGQTARNAIERIENDIDKLDKRLRASKDEAEIEKLEKELDKLGYELARARGVTESRRRTLRRR